MGDCIFCRIARGEVPCNKVYEDDECICFLDTNPVSRGHSLVVTKRHYVSLLTVPKNLVAHTFQVAQLVSQACVAQLGATGVNVVTNVNRSAGQSVFHFHIHVIPRYEDDGLGSLFDHPIALPSDQFPLLADSIREGIDD